jgi:hypothetical protein
MRAVQLTVAFVDIVSESAFICVHPWFHFPVDNSVARYTHLSTLAVVNPRFHFAPPVATICRPRSRAETYVHQSGNGFAIKIRKLNCNFSRG